MQFTLTTRRQTADHEGYSRACIRKAIVSRLRQRYPTVRSGRFALNPYHVWFISE